MSTTLESNDTATSQQQSVIVIGGGLGGLASACTLAARGFSVTLLEQNAWVGGKAAVLERDGFRFDMGPTILTLPSVLRKIFREADRNIDDYLDLRLLDPQWRCFFSDQTMLDLVADVEAMTARIDRFTGDDKAGKGYRSFVDASETLHDISDRYFFWRSVGGVSDTLEGNPLWKPQTLRDFWNLKMGKSVAGTVRSHIPDERVAQMVDHFTQYVGSSPEASPAVLCGIAHMQTSEGVWYPIGGTRAVPTALEKLARELGVTIRTDAEVTGITTTKKKVTGVRLASGEEFTADLVVSNSDSVRTFDELIGPGPARQAFIKRRTYEPACSGVVLYLGLRDAYEHLLHHNFVFSEDPEAEFDDIYKKGRPAEDPTCYVCAPARTEPGVAPPGGEALYILVHTPYLRDGHDWSKMLPEYRRVILDKLASCAEMGDIEDRIVCESALTPQSIQDRYRVWKGAIYGLASHGKYLGAFKPANRSPEVQGLYLAGGSAHPGPGMPMALMSGWIAADALAKDAG